MDMKGPRLQLQDPKQNYIDTYRNVISKTKKMLNCEDVTELVSSILILRKLKTSDPVQLPLKLVSSFAS